MEDSGIHTGGCLNADKEIKTQYASIQIDDVAQIHFLVDQSLVEGLIVVVPRRRAEVHCSSVKNNDPYCSAIRLTRLVKKEMSIQNFVQAHWRIAISWCCIGLSLEKTTASQNRSENCQVGFHDSLFCWEREFLSYCLSQFVILSPPAHPRDNPKDTVDERPFPLPFCASQLPSTLFRIRDTERQ